MSEQLATQSAQITYFVAVAASLVLVAALLFVRTRVRQVRQRTLDELRLLFFPGEEVSIAAFDYVRAKYEMPTPGGGDQGLPMTRPISTFALAGSALPYMLVCGVGFVILMMPVANLINPTWSVPMLGDSLFWNLSGADKPREAAAVFGAAFLGGYLMTGRMLLRSVQNYELTQLTFLHALTHLAFGIVTAMMVYHVLSNSGIVEWVGAPSGDKVFPAFLLVAFICGYVPTLGLVMLSQRIRFRVFKAADHQALENAKAVPLEIIEGIDYDAAERLRQAGICDVQTLATSNPILLYVEAPFALYCVFDWVLQAQLCVSVGPRCFERLKQYNIRTSIDLERAILANDAPDEFVLSLGPLLLPAMDAAKITTAAVKHVVMLMLDDLHIHRSRLLWRHVYAQISRNHGQWIYREDAAADIQPCREDGRKPTCSDPRTAGSDADKGDVQD